MTPDHLRAQAIDRAKALCTRTDAPRIVVSPYRFNSLGAHIDHQGGQVLAKTLDQYTLLPFWPDTENCRVKLFANTDWAVPTADFLPGVVDAKENWIRYAQAAAAALNQYQTIHTGITGHVTGTLVGAGLSSSASVVLAYLYALAGSNNLQLTASQFIELSRQVENDYLGLNNGVMDQMSIMYCKADAMACIDSQARSVSYIRDHATTDSVCWVICYSGVSRQLISSGYNNRVEECKAAAAALDPAATTLGDVDRTLYKNNPDNFLDQLPTMLANRARHFFTESERVNAGSTAWRTGDFTQFGTLMNQSCHSSITNYECGSQPLIDLHEIGSSLTGVFGSRFGGGGYGGCLIMLTDATHANTVCEQVIEQYRRAYPDNKTAGAFIANPESGIRIETMK